MLNREKVQIILNKLRQLTKGNATINQLDIRRPDCAGVWVRDDGSRYTDFWYINTQGNADTTELVWKFLLTQQVSRTLEVSGEMRSDKYDPAIIINNVLYINRGRRIKFGSPNRLKNTSVWRSREPQQETT